ncbi:hypothetical protein MX000_08325 [Streptococcus uberis]|uniref:hypothetical protein n=1 Tax=Streptococcus uberis TaxID=1349 RepID=UPI0027DDBB7D|nr:hypothetical protein [Streptococcus uberis]MCK1224728.1 hypothetical protein [Streptococcus uberis]
MSKKNKKGFYDYLETLSKNGSGIAKVGSGLLIGAVYKALFDKFKKKINKITPKNPLIQVSFLNMFQLFSTKNLLND